MTDEMVDLYPYPIPDGFHPGTSFSGTFITAFIANADNLKLPEGHPQYEDKPKYAFSCAVPFENRKTQCREVQSVKFSCTEEDYRHLVSVRELLKFQSVHLVCVPDAWANSSTKYGIFYRYVPNSIRRFDGKPLIEHKGNVNSKPA
ncbi:TPA: hypothetical protein G9F26_003962 [Salmonella enterica]|uniref:Uncharacterized protein n=1 Tax=Salmonella enterica TaxID=28901 RepID=A0A750HYE8_SALER|nr:hypothetical protein [Salmonella enterica]